MVRSSNYSINCTQAGIDSSKKKILNTKNLSHLNSSYIYNNTFLLPSKLNSINVSESYVSTMNIKNNNKTLLYEESIKLKTKINKLRKELALAKSYNNKKDEEIKKRERAIEKAKNQLKENNSFGNLKEENIIIKLKDNYQILKERIKKQVEKNNKLQNEIKQLNLNDLEAENNNNLAILKDKIDEYKNNLQYNMDCNNELNSYTFNKREFYKNHLYIEKMQKLIEEKTKKIDLMKENLQTMKDKLYQIEENRKRIISYNDSIKKQNEKLLLDKKKREDFILKKPIILGKINEYEAKAKNFEDKYKSNENEIENLNKERNKITKQIKESEISKPIDYDKLKYIEKNPKEKIDQKILLLESLIKESKDRQNQFIEIFAYYDDYMRKKENYEMINNEVKLIEENNIYNGSQNNNSLNNSPDNKKNKDEEDNNEDDISLPFMPSSINSNDRANLNRLNESNENQLLKGINKNNKKEKINEENEENNNSKNIQEIKENNIINKEKNEEKEEINKNQDNENKKDIKSHEIVNIYNEIEGDKNNNEKKDNKEISINQKKEETNKSQEIKKNEAEDNNTLKQNFENNEDKEINEQKKENNYSNNKLMNDKKEEIEINEENKDMNNEDKDKDLKYEKKEDVNNEDKTNNNNGFNIINNDFSIDNKDIKNDNKESSNENKVITNDNKEINSEKEEKNIGDNIEKKSEESNLIEKDKINNNLNEKDKIGSKKKNEKKIKDFKLVFSIMLAVKKISNEQIEKIISMHKADSKDDKNTFILNMSKDILSAINDNNDNDIKLLKKLLIYLLEEKYGNNEELFFNNIVNDLISKNKLTFAENEDEENKLLGKIIEAYSTKSKLINEKLNKDNKKYISYKNLKKYLKEENLYIKNNKEKIELFKFFMFVLKKNTSPSDKNFSMFDFIVEEVVNFFEGIFDVKNGINKNDNANEAGLTITDEDFTKIIDTFIKKFNTFLIEKNETLNNLLGEDNINIMIKSGKEIEVINIYKFVDILNQKGFKLDDNFFISCIFAKYQVDENLEDININILNNDLKNS